MSRVKIKDASTKCNVSFSPTSGIIEGSTKGGLSAEPYFCDEGFGDQPKSTGSQSPTICDGYLHQIEVHGASPDFSGGMGGGGSGGLSAGGGGLGGSGSSSSGRSFGGSGGIAYQDLKSGWEKISSLEESLDKLDSTQSGGEDAMVLPGDIILRNKQEVVAILEGFLGANCDIPVRAFTSPHFLFNEVMVILGCTLPDLDKFTKLKCLSVSRQLT